MQRTRFLGLVVSFVVLLAGVASAQDKTWNGSVSTDWHTDGNWTPNGAPTNDQSVLIPEPTGIPNYPPSLGNTDENDDITLQLERGATLDTATANLDINSITVVAGGIGAVASIIATGGGAGDGVQPRDTDGTSTFSATNGNLIIARVFLDMQNGGDNLDFEGSGNSITIGSLEWVDGEIRVGNGGTTPAVTITDIDTGTNVEPITVTNGSLTIGESLNLISALTVNGGTVTISGNLTVTNSAGNITVGNSAASVLDVNGSLDLGTGGGVNPSHTHSGGTIRVSGDWSAGADDEYVASTNTTVVFDGATQSITAADTQNDVDFFNVTITGSGTKTFSFTNANFEVDGSLAVQDGTLDLAGETLVVGGTTTIGDGDANAAVLMNAAGAVQVQGNVTLDPTDGDYSPGGTFTFTTNSAAWSGGGDDFGTVIVNAAGQTISVTGTDVSATTLTVTAGTLAVTTGRTFSATGAGNVISVTGSLTNAGTVQVSDDISIGAAGSWTGAGTLTFTGNTDHTITNASATDNDDLGEVVDATTANLAFASTANSMSVRSLTLNQATKDLDLGNDTLRITGTATATEGLLFLAASGTITNAGGNPDFQFTGTTGAAMTWRDDASIPSFLNVSITTPAAVTLATSVVATTLMIDGASASLSTGGNTLDLDGGLGGTAGGTLTLGTGTLLLGGGTVDLSAIALSGGSGTTTFDGGAVAMTVNGGNDSFGVVSVTGGNTVTVTNTASFNVAGTLTLTSGGLTLNGTGGATFTGDVTLNANTLTLGSNTVTVTGDFDGSTGTLSASSSTVVFNDTTAQAVTIDTNSDTFGTIQVTNAGTTTISGAGQTLVVTGGLAVSGGTLELDVSSTVQGAAGTDVSGGATLSSAGTTGLTHSFLGGAGESLDVTGSSFIMNAPGLVIRFATNSTVDVNGASTFTIIGTSANRISLGDETDGGTTDWTIDVDSTVSFTATSLNVFDSEANGTGSPVFASDGTADAETNDWIFGRSWSGAANDGNWANGANWIGGVPPLATEAAFFGDAGDGNQAPTSNTPQMLTNLIVDAGYQPLANGPITLTQNLTLTATVGLGLSYDTGGAGSRLTIGANNFLIVNGSASVSGPLSNGTGRLRFDGAASVGLTLGGAGTAVNALLDVGTGGGPTVLTLQNGNALDADAILLEATSTFDTGTLDASVAITASGTFAGVLTAETSQVSVGGDWSSLGAGNVLFNGIGRLTFNGASPQALSVNSTDQYQNASVTGAGGVTLQAASETWDLNGTLSVTNGTLDLNGESINVGNGTDSSCTTTSPGTITDSGTGTLTLEPAANAQGNPLGGSGAVTVGNLSVGGNQAGGRVRILNGSALVVVKTQLTVNSGRVLNLEGTLELRGNGATPFSLAGTFQDQGGTGTFRYAATAGGTSAVAVTTYTNLDVSPTAAHTYTLGTGTTTVSTALTVGANGALQTAGNAFDLNGTASISGSLQNGAGGISSAGNFTVQAGGDYIPNGGTLTFDGTGSWSAPAGEDFGAVSVTAGTRTATSPLQTTTLGVSGGNLDIDTQTLIATGAVSQTGGTLTIDTGGVLECRNGLSSTGTVANTGEIRFTTNAQAWSGTATFENVEVANVAVTAGSALTADTLEVTGAAGVLSMGANGLTLRANLDLDAGGANDGALVMGAGTLTFTGIAGNQTSTLARGTDAATVIGALALTQGGATTLEVDVTGAAILVGGATSVGANTTLDVQVGTGATFVGTVTIADDGTLRVEANCSFQGTTGGNSVLVTGNDGLFENPTTAVTLTFQAGQVLRVNGDIDVSPTLGQTTLLSSSPGVQFGVEIGGGASQNFVNIRVRDSDGNADPAPIGALTAGTDATAGANGTNLGNTIDWVGLIDAAAEWDGEVSSAWDDPQNYVANMLPLAGAILSFDTAGIGNPAPSTGVTPATLGGITVTANYAPQAGSTAITLTGNLTLTGSLLLDNGSTASVNVATNILSLMGSAQVDRPVTGSTGALRFNGNAAQGLSVTGGSIGVQLQAGDGTATGTLTPTTPVTVPSLLGALNYTLAIANQTFTVTGPSTVNGGLTSTTGTFVSRGDFDSSGAGTVAFGTGGIIRFEVAATPSVTLGTNDAFHHLQVSGSALSVGAGSTVLDLNGGLTILGAGSLTLLAAAGADIEGTVTLTSGNWNLNGATATVGGGTDATIDTTGGLISDTAGVGTLSLEAAAGGNSVGGAGNITVGNLSVATGRANLTSPLTTVLVATSVANGADLGGPNGANVLDTVAFTLVGTGEYVEGTGTTRVSGTLTIPAGATWTNGTGELQLDGANQQWNGSGNAAGGVGNVRKTTGVVTLVTGNGRVTTLTVDAGTTFAVADRTLEITGNVNPPLVVNGALNGTTGTVAYLATVPNPVSLADGANVQYPNLTLTGSGAGHVFNVDGAVNVNQVLTVNPGTLSVNGANVLTLTGSGTPFAATGTLTMATGATVAYTGAGAVTLRATTYQGRLNVGGAVAGTYATGTTTVGTVLTVGVNATLSAGDLSLAGNGTPLVVAGTISTAAGTVRYTNAVGANVTATSYPALSLENGSFTPLGNVTAAAAVSITGAFTLGGTTLQGQSVTGAGTLDVGGGSTVRLTGTVNPFSVTTVNGLTTIPLSRIEYAGTNAQVRTSTAPDFVYGNLDLSGGGQALSTPAVTNIHVAGNLRLLAATTFAAGQTVEFESTAGLDSTFDCGTSIVGLAGLVVDKANNTQAVFLTGADLISRVATTVTVNAGILNVGCDWTFVQGVIGQPGGLSDAAQLLVNVPSVDLTIGDGQNRIMQIRDVFRLGDTNTPDIRIILAVNPVGGTRAQLLLDDPAASLTFLGRINPPNQVRIESSANGTAGLIVRPQVNGNATITASFVSVLDNDATQVIGPLGVATPIQAGGLSIDRGNTPGWSFVAGGALRITAVTAQGDGAGSIDRMRIAYSLPLNAGTVGDVFRQFTLRLMGPVPGQPPLQSLGGTAASVLPSQLGNVLEVRFEPGVAKTDVAGLELRYVPPQTNFLTSDAGIPAAQPETINASTSPVIVDGAAPVVVSSFFQDVDQNGAFDRLNLFCSEAAGFASGLGTSISGFNPVTSTIDLGLNTSLTVQVAGEAPVTLNLTPGGVPRFTGDDIAQRIQDAVRFLVGTAAPLVPGHDPLRRAAYANFTCEFTNGRYLLRAGVPLRFDAGTGSYAHDWAGSTVNVVAGPNDAAPQLGLGAANGGVERPGAGDARAGISVSGPISPDTIAIPAGTSANLLIDGETVRAFQFTGMTTILENVAFVLEGRVRAADVEALNPPNQAAYSGFVAIPHRNHPGGARLVLVSGAPGPGSSVVVASSATDPFSTIAAMGSVSFAAGASEAPGAPNTTVSLADLSVRAQDGSNLLLGRTASDLTIAGAVITVALANTPGSGQGTPTFSFADDGDGMFLCDTAPVPNLAGGGASNLPAGSAIVLVGDDDGDLTLDLSPGAALLDAAQSVLPMGTSGVNASFSWSFLAGPGAITLPGGTVVTAPSAGISNQPAFSFNATTSTTSGTSYLFELVVTLTDGSGQPVINAFTDAQGRVVSRVTVTISEDPPIAMAGSDQLVIALDATLDGSSSFDPNGGAITFQWSAIDPLGLPVLPSAFDDPTLGRPRFAPGGPGTYTVTVTVSKVADPTLVAADSAVVTLVDPSNLPPFAAAGPDVVGRIGLLTTLDGRGSIDPENAQLVFTWSPVQLAAPAVLSDLSSPTPTFTPTLPGAYTFRLTVRDPSGQTDVDDVTVLVQDDLSPQPRLAPAAEPRVASLRRTAFVDSAPTGAGGQGVLPVLILEAGLERQVTTIDLAADPLDDPPPGSTSGLLVAHAVVGPSLFASYYAAPQPGDGEPVAIRFVPGGPSVPLIAYGVTGQPFVLDGTRSQDDGVISTFRWRQLSGPFQFTSRDGNLLAVVPQSAGTYEFELTVIDNTGLTSLPRKVKVPVVPAGDPAVGPPRAQLALASPFSDGPPPVLQGTLGGGVSIDGSSSASRNGGTLTFRWTQLSGPLAGLGGADTAQLQVQSLPAAGPYLFELTVTDQNGVSETVEVWVAVGAPGQSPPRARLADVPTLTLGPDGTVTVVIDGSQSSGQGQLTYRWHQVRGMPLFIDPTTGATATLTVTRPGVYEVVLEVQDAGGVNSAPMHVTFEVMGTADPTLASGASFKKSSGGCALEPGSSGGGAFFALALLVLLSLRAVRVKGA